MCSPLARLLLIALVALGALLPAPVRAAPEPLPAMDLRLEIEPLLIGEEGIHPLNAANPDLAMLPGAIHQFVQLGAGTGYRLLFVLRYELADPDTIVLTLERSVYRGETVERELPEMRHRMEVLDSWHATILDDIGTGERMVLRVTPIIRPAVTDEEFDSRRLGMRFLGGPAILFGSGADQDRVTHRAVNVDGVQGLALGVRGLGFFRIAPREFPGAVRAGWVRGHQWRVSIGGHELGGWSNVQVLPDDPHRPGAGWILYAAYEPPGEDDRNFYGGFAVEGD